MDVEEKQAFLSGFKGRSNTNIKKTTMVNKWTLEGDRLVGHENDGKRFPRRCACERVAILPEGVVWSVV